jgi:hypothetical protein
VYDPTDEKGQISPPFISHTPLYINEPPPPFQNNCCWVFHKKDDFDQTTNLEIWTFREIKKGNQLFIFYGNDYFREYPINRSEDACGLPSHFNFSIFSPQKETPGKIFVVQEYPAWMCELLNPESEKKGGNLADFWNAEKQAQKAKKNPLLLIEKCTDLTLVPFLQVLDKILNPTTYTAFMSSFFLYISS